MGTNYYYRKDACVHCGRSDEELHIGKSSGGWCFSLHVIPEENINTLDDWVEFITNTNGKIFDEYEREKTLDELLDVTLNRSWHQSPADIDFTQDWLYSYRSLDDFLRINNAVLGPNNLLRNKIDGVHCVGHGNGTYDLIEGEFS